MKIKIFSCENNANQPKNDIVRLTYSKKEESIDDSTNSAFRVSCMNNVNDNSKVNLIFSMAYTKEQILLTFEADKSVEYLIVQYYDYYGQNGIIYIYNEDLTLV